MFVESICNDFSIIENNIRETKLRSPDYVGKGKVYPLFLLLSDLDCPQIRRTLFATFCSALSITRKSTRRSLNRSFRTSSTLTWVVR